MEYDDAPIGIFDSGFGGLTVAREIIKALPEESIIFFGDRARCPYGPRDPEEVKGFVLRICEWLCERKVKMIVIACNTATAAGLEAAQQTFDIPIIGVIEPGARAAARATHNRRVGVIATKGTVESGVYTRAIRNIDAGITVFSTATPRFVEIAELGIRMAKGPIENYTSLASKVYIRPAFQEIAQDYLDPLRRSEIDTLVLGCTHFPLLKALIGGVIGSHVKLISSAKEVSLDCKDLLTRRESLAHPGHIPLYQFASSDPDVDEFASFGERVLRMPLGEVLYAPLDQEVGDGFLVLRKGITMTKTIIIATNNAHKVEEIETALSFKGWEFKTLKEAGIVSNPEETGTTFVENARIKAKAAHDLSGKATLADDSGLIVDALDGAPGVYSSRYSGVEGDDAANNAKLLRELADTPKENRSARFACSLVFIDEDGSETVAEGFVEGSIGFEECGDGGFGYDPLFFPDLYEGTKTMAELTQDEKNKISHRGNALRNLKKLLHND